MEAKALSRKAITTSKRAAIWRAHDRRCIYCRELVDFADLDVDHIIPLHLKDKPAELSKLLDEYEFSGDFDIDDLSNLVPSHRRCNLQKLGRVFSKNRALHFLSIAENKYSMASDIELELKKQVEKDEFTIKVQVALETGRISHEELSLLVNSYAESQNMNEVLATFPFVNSELKGFISTVDVETLYDRPILPRLHGLDKLTMVRAILHSEEKEEKTEVCTCREWVDAIRDGYYACTTYDIKEESFFKNVYALIIALAQAKTPKYKFISDGKASIANFDLLPVTLLPALSSDNVEGLQQLKTAGVSIPDLIAQERVKIISSSPLSLTLHYDGMGLYLNEILRADLNDDGIEDLLIASYEWVIEGTFGAGSTIALTRLGVNQPFTIVEDIELEVRARHK